MLTTLILTDSVTVAKGGPGSGPRPGQRRRKPQFEVLVGNIGHVHSGDNEAEAMDHFNRYVGQSKSGVGRAGKEDVTLFRDGSIVREHDGIGYFVDRAVRASKHADDSTKAAYADTEAADKSGSRDAHDKAVNSHMKAADAHTDAARKHQDVGDEESPRRTELHNFFAEIHQRRAYKHSQG